MKLRGTILLLASLSLLSGQAFADTLEQEFAQRRTQRDKHVNDAVADINRRYVSLLEQLLKRATQAGNLDLAIQLRAEIQAAAGGTVTEAPAGAKVAEAPGGNGQSPPASAPAEAPANPPTKQGLRRLFETTLWYGFGSPQLDPVHIQPADKKKSEFVFHKDGTLGCDADAVGYWVVETPDVLKLYKNDPKKKPAEPFASYRIDFTNKTAAVDPELGGTKTAYSKFLKFERLEKGKKTP